jgi:hypothetical protein
MNSKRKAPFKTLFYILVLSLLTVYTFAPTQGIADGNGGLPVGGLASAPTVDSTSQSTIPESSDTEETDVSFLTLFWEAIVFLL